MMDTYVYHVDTEACYPYITWIFDQTFGVASVGSATHMRLTKGSCIVTSTAHGHVGSPNGSSNGRVGSQEIVVLFVHSCHCTVNDNESTIDVAEAGRLIRSARYFRNAPLPVAHQGASLLTSPLTRAWMLLAGLDRCHAAACRVNSKPVSKGSGLPLPEAAVSVRCSVSG